LDQILSLSPKPHYDDLFKAILQRKGQYPVPPPLPPSELEPRRPPNWTPHHRIFETPSFRPPYYPPRLSRLNRFVDAVHLGETQRVTLALARKADLEAQLEQRNKQVEALAGNALARWKTAKEQQAASFLKIQAEHRKHAKAYAEALRDEQGFVRWQIDLTMRTACQPSFLSREARTTFEDSSGILLHEHRFPDLQSLTWLKNIELKDKRATRPANEEEKKEAAAKLWPSLCLRLASQIARLDTENILKAITINGWTDYTDQSTGQEKRAYCASLLATKDQIAALDLPALDPVAEFQKLKGAVSLTRPELTPITPVVRLDTPDPRFVEPTDVLARMSDRTKLASTD
jgi:hypothetical protein